MIDSTEMRARRRQQVLREIAWGLALLTGVLYVVGAGSFKGTVVALLLLLSVQIGLLP